MNTVTDFVKEHDGNILYVIFAIQCAIVFLGFPLLLFQCSSEQKRLNLSYGRWMVKWVLCAMAGKWLLETYDLVEMQINNPKESFDTTFDPYKLLHIENDGSFGTQEIRAAFQRLAEKYHPSKVNPEKVPYVKALKRW